MEQLVITPVAANAVILTPAELNGTHSREVLGILGNLDQILWLCAVRNCNFPFLPHARNICLPSLTHATNETVRTA